MRMTLLSSMFWMTRCSCHKATKIAMGRGGGWSSSSSVGARWRSQAYAAAQSTIRSSTALSNTQKPSGASRFATQWSNTIPQRECHFGTKVLRYFWTASGGLNVPKSPSCPRLRGVEGIDVAQQFFEAGSNVGFFGAQRIQLGGQLNVGFLSFGDFHACEVALVTQTVYEGNSALDALFQLTESIGGNSGCGHMSLFCRSRSSFEGRIKGCLCLGGDSCELSTICGGSLSQHLAVQFDPGQLQAMHQLAVRKPGFARSGTDADNPQRAKFPLLQLAPDVGVL